jgi:hypothetical protein
MLGHLRFGFPAGCAAVAVPPADGSSNHFRAMPWSGSPAPRRKQLQTTPRLRPAFADSNHPNPISSIAELNRFSPTR